MEKCISQWNCTLRLSHRLNLTCRQIRSDAKLLHCSVHSAGTAGVKDATEDQKYVKPGSRVTDKDIKSYSFLIKYIYKV